MRNLTWEQNLFNFRDYTNEFELGKKLAGSSNAKVEDFLPQVRTIAKVTNFFDGQLRHLRL